MRKILKFNGTRISLSVVVISTVSLLCMNQAVNAELLLFDNFNYVVGRSNAGDYTGTNNPFVTIGPWTNVKAVNITGSWAGYLYTVPSVAGYTGLMPNQTGMVLKMESPGVSGGSDFYLQYGGNTPNTVPADVWFQFWIFINHTGSELSRLERRHKFIYPCDGDYPCTTNKWLLSLNCGTSNPHNVWPPPYGDPTQNGEAFLLLKDHRVGNIWYSRAPESLEASLGQHNISEYLEPNRWQLVKIHVDTSNPSSGKYEAWIMPLDGRFVKVSEWIGGVTPDFTWTIPEAGGHRSFKMPTTIGWTDGGGYTWYYMDDFAMATTEASLPVYGNSSVIRPSRLRIVQ